MENKKVERRKIVAVIGNKKIEKGSVRYQMAYEIGKALVDNGYRVLTGGVYGVMEAAMEGARASKNYREGDTVAIIPSFDSEMANEYADVVIPTGLDAMRNAIVANAYAVIGVGGGAGTLCEYAFAWSFKRLIIAFKNTGGWSEKLADTRIASDIRYPDIPEDKVYGVESAEEAIALLDKYVDRYTLRHVGIKE
ncbi:MAG: acyl-CoA synthetase [Clostridia bacterium]|nr:acyl-CoA synthetase [Clostridia bacterium]